MIRGAFNFKHLWTWDWRYPPLPLFWPISPRFGPFLKTWDSVSPLFGPNSQRLPKTNLKAPLRRMMIMIVIGRSSSSSLWFVCVKCQTISVLYRVQTKAWPSSIILGRLFIYCCLQFHMPHFHRWPSGRWIKTRLLTSSRTFCMLLYTCRSFSTVSPSHHSSISSSYH